MKQTLTAKIQVFPDSDQKALLSASMDAFRAACNFVSMHVYDTRNLSASLLNRELYREIRSRFGLPSQMTQSAIRSVIGSYRSMKSNGRWEPAEFGRAFTEETVGIDAILARIGREAEKNQGTGGLAINADALSAIQAAVDASVTMRKKKRLLELFLAQVNNGGDASGDAFLALVQHVYDDAVNSLVKELNLRDGAVEFVKRCVDAGYVLEAGSGLDRILPPVRRFGGGNHGAIRERAIEAIQRVVDEFEGLYIN